MGYSMTPTVNEISVPTRVCEKVWFFSLILDQPTNPIIKDNGKAVRPNTKISEKIGPVTPAQWILTFQNKLTTVMINETKVQPKANKNNILVFVIEKIMVAIK